MTSFKWSVTNDVFNYLRVEMFREIIKCVGRFVRQKLRGREPFDELELRGRRDRERRRERREPLPPLQPSWRLWQPDWREIWNIMILCNWNFSKKHTKSINRSIVGLWSKVLFRNGVYNKRNFRKSNRTLTDLRLRMESIVNNCQETWACASGSYLRGRPYMRSRTFG